MKKKIVLLVILIVLLLAGGIAYAYYATDLFKTDKEMFFSYLIDEKTGTEFNQEKLIEYYAKQESTPYESNGEISFDTTGMSQSQGLTKAKIAFEGKTVNSR